MVKLSRQEKKEIVEAIRCAEMHTSGQIRVHLKDRCGENVLEEAKKIFTRLGMHRTKEHSAVLIFVAPASRRFAIVGDSGIHARAGQDFWHHSRDAMAQSLAQGRLKEAILTGIGQAAEELKKYFPAKPASGNELSDKVTEN